jgi:hypothetical protein
VERIRKLYREQLSHALKGMDSVMSEYMNWERKTSKRSIDTDETIMTAYRRAKAELNTLTNFEDKIEASSSTSGAGSPSPEALQAWYEYLAYEQEHCPTPTRVLVVSPVSASLFAAQQTCSRASVIYHIISSCDEVFCDNQ